MNKGDVVKLTDDCLARYWGGTALKDKKATVVNVVSSHGMIDGKPVEYPELRILFEGESSQYVVSPNDCVLAGG